MTKKRGGSGGLSRRTALALISGGGLLGISSTGAFDQVGADRAFDISVDDNNALLGVTLLQDSFEVSEKSEINPDLLQIENQSSESEGASEETGTTFNSVKVEVPQYNRYVQFELDTEDLDDGLAPDSSVTIPSTISGKKSTTSSIPITLTVTASSDDEGIVIETTRTVSISVAASSYEPGTCPVSVNVGGDALPEQESEGSITVTDQDVAEGIDAGGSATITARGNRPVIIGGNVKADGSISIAANGNDTTVIIDGDLEAGGAIDISGNGSITIGGGVNADGDITITARGNGTITICGEVESDDGDLTTTENGNNASVSINAGDDDDDSEDNGGSPGRGPPS